MLCTKRCIDWCMLLWTWINPALLFCSTNTVVTCITGSYAMADTLHSPHSKPHWRSPTYFNFSICFDILHFLLIKNYIFYSNPLRIALIVSLFILANHLSLRLHFITASKKPPYFYTEIIDKQHQVVCSFA